MLKLNNIKLDTQIFDRGNEIPLVQKKKEMVQQITTNGVNTTVYDLVTLLINSIKITKCNGQFEVRMYDKNQVVILAIYSTFQKAVNDINRVREHTEKTLLTEILKQLPTRFEEVFDSQNSLGKYTRDAINAELQDQTRFFDGETFDVILLEPAEKECFSDELVQKFNKPLNKLFAIGLATNDNADQRLWAWDVKQWNKFYQNSSFIG